MPAAEGRVGVGLVQSPQWPTIDPRELLKRAKEAEGMEDRLRSLWLKTSRALGVTHPSTIAARLSYEVARGRPIGEHKVAA